MKFETKFNKDDEVWYMKNNKPIKVIISSIKTFIGSCIWNFSEYFHVPIGKYAPIVFGWMINSKGKELKDEDN